MKAPVSLAWHEFAHAHFGHWTRTTRVMQMWERLSSHPSGTVSAVFEVPAERKGAYRFLESPKVRWEPLAEAVHVATARRCSRHALVIGIVDGSSIAHTDRRGDDGVGSVGSRRMGGRGIKSMILLAASFDGVPLGVGAHVLWSRPDTAGTSDALRPLAEKESRHWTGLQEEFESVLRAEGADTRVWYQIDREGDASHVLLRGVEPGQMVTVRSNKDIASSTPARSVAGTSSSAKPSRRRPILRRSTSRCPGVPRELPASPVSSCAPWAWASSCERCGPRSGSERFT
ncbi:MAG: hypothetical protein IPF99_28545 [Deltaproteobacteria bacterium]|nr:hypothetical protein [Deltaproteobacteria bacterium]